MGLPSNSIFAKQNSSCHLLLAVVLGTFLVVPYRVAATGVRSEEIAKVSVNLSAWLSINGSTHLDRGKYFNVHGVPGELSDDELRYVTQELGAGFGRRVGGLVTALRRAGEDSDRPGHVNVKRLMKGSRSAEDAPPKWDIVDTTHPHAYFHHAEDPDDADRFVPASHKAAAEAVAAYFAGRRDELPAYFEVANEINVHLQQLGTDWESVCDLHGVMAERLKQEFPQMLVGGPCSAYPAFEIKDFGLWNRHMGQFIDRVGGQLDFLSVHLYTTHWDDKENYRFGANIDAILDLMENASLQSTGRVMPLLISECGTGFRVGERIHDEYSPRRDWMVITGANHLFFSLQKRDDRLLKMIPFMVLKASWYKEPTPYPWALFHSVNGEWQPTHLVKWFQFWRDAQGRFLPVESSDENVQTLAVVDGKTLRLYLDNLSRSAKHVTIADIKGVELSGTGETVKLTRIYLDGDMPVVRSSNLSASHASLTLSPEEAVCLEYSLAKPLELKRELVETTHYATQTLVPITAQSCTFDIEVSEGEKLPSAATVRLGISRNRTLSRKPAIRLNGQRILTIGKERGDGQTLVEDQFGTIEYEIPSELIRKDNRLTVTFDEPGGRIATAILCVKRLSDAGSIPSSVESANARARVPRERIR